ncbi:hypothetical protein AXE65_00190 [Ventosimonas gracilis]|uniref:UPF0102 protein AXE65_00190 n=1 Tax=Ventosimonas gracilis TaxID=1680762 RepID=A0A139SVL6_9GAMM|nr:YraN family protein [Ventosimonas gracilis]KXU38619.1 hypothetical protein AXE65_00190 [Ventosimonas gracilis]
MTSSERGREAEACALAFLQSQGLRLLRQNWRCRFGELDLVMQDKDSLVFVEVRYRRNSHFGGAVQSVDASKQRKLARSAQQFLQQQAALNNKPCRFDVITLGEAAKPQWIKNAFELPEGCY